MLQPARGLSPADLQAIAELNARTVAFDGGRLKLEWGSLRSRSGQDVEDLLWWDGDQLVGFLGLYSFGAPSVELAGMVDPQARRRGIGTELVNAALPLCRKRGYHPILLVTPRDNAASAGFAKALSGVLDHSEHALVLTEPPAAAPAGPGVHLRAATETDRARVGDLLTQGFGYSPGESSLGLDSADRTVVVEVGDETLGTMRLALDGTAGSIYGFVVDTARRGRGIGRAALGQACLQLRTQGATQVGLEVAVENEHALGLYTSVGFTRVTTEDYYALSPS